MAGGISVPDMMEKVPVASADWTMPTILHANRIEVVHQALLQRRARRILDLGCGCGPLLQQLARDRRFERIVGVDTSIEALLDCERQLLSQRIPVGGRISLLHMSFTAAPLGFETFDAAILVETIEHIPPHRLSIAEHTVFGIVQPGTVLITTPNKECNAVLGVPPQRLRHPDHKFEWTRAKFEAWSTGAARRHGYGVEFSGIGGRHPIYGSPTQMAIFTRELTADTL